ncbi:hypothetical protein MMC10_011037 [Thelotrema lepadinum]|nr:hypothetical protein [Thelotrema lepadinum]
MTQIQHVPNGAGGWKTVQQCDSMQQCLNQGKKPTGLSRRGLLYDEQRLHAIGARDAIPEVISDSNGQPIWTRDDGRIAIRALRELRLRHANAPIQARDAIFTERDGIDTRWTDVDDLLEARGVPLGERGLDFDDSTANPTVW